MSTFVKIISNIGKPLSDPLWLLIIVLTAGAAVLVFVLLRVLG